MADGSGQYAGRPTPIESEEWANRVNLYIDESERATDPAEQADAIARATMYAVALCAMNGYYPTIGREWPDRTDMNR